MSIDPGSATSTVSPSRSPRNPSAASFLELSRQVKDDGLMNRRLGWYAGRAGLLVAGFATAGVLLFTLGRSPWQLAVAVFVGVLLTQTAFLGHDAAHHQVFASGRRNEWFSRIVGNLVVGLSHGWWSRKHSKHHAHPNTIGKDGDIATGALVFDPADAPARTGLLGWITRRQGWLFFPMLTLEGLNLHVGAVRTIVGQRGVKHRATEAALICVRLLGFPALVIVLLGPALGLAFLAIQLATFGVYMGASFAPNHKGMPLLGKEVTMDFLRRQVLTSRNIRGGRWLTWGMGGLNFQIEHHLFPRMPSMNLRRAQPTVRRLCAELDIPYTETGLAAAYGIVVGYLNRVGLGYADPFDCPFAAQYRPV
ncbi:acyl-CoA desaturase [Natronosporangium hydrolyticum]|uniref:Acyl-CoA desaturase n=1 Tax=Natronosporangium hydrolyticum TaxID=2811111 RepID=A0A895YL00_9ACTN|nr:acyl-CoA desaturase [Natronosporangium hydrolyticum]QSB15973.1 acyl-CoA desaturase [Natronosporangium hydrolyticum]